MFWVVFFMCELAKFIFILSIKSYMSYLSTYVFSESDNQTMIMVENIYFFKKTKVHF